MQTHPVEGEPAEAILNVAEETKADLIVVGNKGMTGARRFLLGSVPNNVSHHAPCSVIIVQNDLGTSGFRASVAVARAASIRPAPWRVAAGPRSRAVWRRRWVTAATLPFFFAFGSIVPLARTIAATPETCAAAIEVPT